MTNLSKEALLLLADLLAATEAGEGTVLAARFRADHADHFDLLDQLSRNQYIQNDREHCRVGLMALPQLDVPAAKQLLAQAERLWAALRQHYLLNLTALTPVAELAQASDMTTGAAQHTLQYMLDVPWHGGYSGGSGKPIASIGASEGVLKHASFLSLIEEVRSWNVIGPPSVHTLTQAMDGLVELPPAAEASEEALPDWMAKLPATAQALMREVHVAKVAGLCALSAMGIRAVVDVACHDRLGGDFGSFAAKTKALRDAGHLTEVQHAALVAVVEAGNAAAHRGYQPDATSLEAMWGALNHMLQSLYVLEDLAGELGRATPKRHGPRA